jgi:RNA polymerase sigma-70 factor (ECF subfamily)
MQSRERPREDLDHPDAMNEACFDMNGRWRIGIRDWQANPRRLLERQEFMAVLRECLAHLPGRMSDVFTLREMEDMDTEALCKLLGLSATNLWVLLHRARMRLRSCLEENWFGAPAGSRNRC